MTVGFGIIGTGMMGRTYAEALATQVSSGRLVAVTGGSRAGALGAEYGVPVDRSSDELLARLDIDIVVIATPHTTHLPLALAAAGGRQARLSREADGPLGRRVRHDPRGRRPRRPARHGRQPGSLQRDLDAREGAHRRWHGRRHPDVPGDSPTVGWDVPADGWFVDPRRAVPTSTGARTAATRCAGSRASEATPAFAMMDNYGGIPAVDPSAMVSYRMASGAMAQFWMSYEIPPPGLGSYMQWLAIGENGMVDFDRDTLRITDGGEWRTELALQPWDWTVDPRAPRRTGADGTTGRGDRGRH